VRHANNGRGRAAWKLVQGLPQRFLLAGVRAYRLLLKPWLGNACRFEPTCSAYALQALHQYGATQGSVLTVWRIARCHPLCHGGCDPVPKQVSHAFKSKPKPGPSSPLP
jgi:uncharacterized protein